MPRTIPSCLESQHFYQPLLFRLFFSQAGDRTLLWPSVRLVPSARGHRPTPRPRAFDRAAGTLSRPPIFKLALRKMSQLHDDPQNMPKCCWLSWLRSGLAPRQRNHGPRCAGSYFTEAGQATLPLSARGANERWAPPLFLSTAGKSRAGESICSSAMQSP